MPLYRFWITRRPEVGDTVNAAGQDTGKMTVVASERSEWEIGHILVIKEAGHSYWSGRFLPRGYQPMQHHVLRLVAKNDGNVQYQQVATY